MNSTGFLKGPSLKRQMRCLQNSQLELPASLRSPLVIRLLATYSPQIPNIKHKNRFFYSTRENRPKVDSNQAETVPLEPLILPKYKEDANDARKIASQCSALSNGLPISDKDMLIAFLSGLPTNNPTPLILYTPHLSLPF
ncbi:hypothetical protein Zmor_022075 [Zophobas morio]|jgi:hypothetical protein|uniref:Uncharacterized protein n=1 Tax=Zophobas morio TaxID=2755281 RepID=A0AA38HKN9_9CUCU|nr:hypothetical protein Zmor_022075 [Zophobas morio]